MDPVPTPTVSAASLAERLALCAAKIGGKRALAAAAGISEAQLFRYISGDSEMPAARVVAVATASDVQPGWLLTGSEQAPTPAAVRAPDFRSELLAAISQTLDEVLVDYPRALPPSRKGKLLSFMYQALRHEEVSRRTPAQVGKGQTLLQLDFLSGPRGEDLLETLACTIQRLEYAPQPEPLLPMEADVFCKLVHQGFQRMYDGISGAMYFERMTDHVYPGGIRRLNALMERARRDNPNGCIHVLDIGCGNGRELAFLHQHHANTSLHGVEVSNQGMALCEAAMRAGRLPVGAVQQSDMCTLPFGDMTFDVAYSHMSFYCLPYFPEHLDCGANLGFAEAARILKRGGLFEVTTMYGEGRDYLPFAQLHTRDSLARLSATHGLELIDFSRPERPTSRQQPINQHQTQAASKYEDRLTAVFKKLP